MWQIGVLVSKFLCKVFFADFYLRKCTQQSTHVECGKKKNTDGVHAIPFSPPTIKSRPNPRCHHIIKILKRSTTARITDMGTGHNMLEALAQNSDVQVFRRILTANSRITGVSFFPRSGGFMAARLVSINGIHVYWWNCWGTSTAPCCYKARWQIWAWVWHIMCGYSVSILVAQPSQFRPQGSWSWNTIKTSMRGALAPCW